MTRRQGRPGAVADTPVEIVCRHGNAVLVITTDRILRPTVNTQRLAGSVEERRTGRARECEPGRPDGRTKPLESCGDIPPHGSGPARPGEPADPGSVRFWT